MSEGGQDFAGKVALVTGGGGGIGRAVAERLAWGGAQVEVAEIHAGRAAECAQAIQAAGGRARASVLDVCDAASVRDWVDGILAAHGQIDVLVNNVGDYRPSSSFADSSPEQWAALQRVNLDHVFLVTHAVLPALRRARGAVVNVASVEGLRGYPSDPVYGAYKAAVIHFSRCLALELAPDGVRVNAIAPDLTQSLQVDYARWVPAEEREKWSFWAPLGRPGEGADQADVVAFLASDAARFVTGHVVPTDGGSLAAGGWFRSPRSGRWVNRPHDP